MPEKLPANTPWKYDYVPQYNLDEHIVNDYLKSIWGNYKYFVEVSHLCDKNAIQDAQAIDSSQRSGDDFRFWVPRKLHKVRHVLMTHAILTETNSYNNAQHEQDELFKRRTSNN